LYWKARVTLSHAARPVKDEINYTNFPKKGKYSDHADNELFLQNLFLDSYLKAWLF